MSKRCSWANEELLREYHDEEWGIAPEDDRGYFEILSLEAFQAGLSWHLVLKKREALRKTFLFFEPESVSSLHDVDEMMADPKLIRNRKKLEATIHNASVFLEVIEDYGSFAEYLKSIPDEPATASKILKKRGFKFMGPVVTESLFQAVGKVSPPHEDRCFLKVSIDENS